MYTSAAQLLAMAGERNVPLWSVILENEVSLSGDNEERIWEKAGRRLDIMQQSAEKALHGGLHVAGGLITGISTRQYAHAHRQDSLCGGFLNLVMARALSCSECNAAMGKICAAPTAGSCGILPAVLISVGEKFELSRRTVLEGLLTASGIGAIIARNATVAGAEGGCQAECGVAAAMAAAAAVQMAGGNNEAALYGASFSLMNAMGLVCDPIAGLVQVPCAQRNASQAVNALLSADLALSGNTCPVPLDEMISAMYKVGRMLPLELKETALGGMAATPAAKKIQKEIFSR